MAVDIKKAKQLLARKKRQGVSGLIAKNQVAQELGCAVSDLSFIVYSNLTVADCGTDMGSGYDSGSTSCD